MEKCSKLMLQQELIRNFLKRINQLCVFHTTLSQSQCGMEQMSQAFSALQFQNFQKIKTLRLQNRYLNHQ